MDFWIPMAFTVLLEVLAEKGKAEKFSAKFAKLYVKLHRVVQSSPTLQAAVEAAEAKAGGA